MEITKTTFNLDSKIFKEFKKICKEKGLVMGKVVEIQIKKWIDLTRK